jgi:asparagine synthase (glutamine-hydrolyzing)
MGKYHSQFKPLNFYIVNLHYASTIWVVIHKIVLDDNQSQLKGMSFMCGITGWINLNRNISCEKDIIGRMTGTLKMRGPDDEGFFISQNCLLGHRRLVIVDPSGGAQPMTRTFDGRSCTVVYNGELYNTEELRSDLLSRGYTFKSYSDTEVLLISYMEWGEECVKHFNGIFAFGIWDDSKKSVFLSRDSLGVKPLFYSSKDGSFIFGSEIKALLAWPGLKPVVDRYGLCEIFGLGPARSPGCGIFKDIFEVMPGYCLTYSIDGLSTKKYWELIARPHFEDLDTTADHVRSLLIDAIERQLVADVPVCTFLSGGLDSSAISAVAAGAFKKDGRILSTYSIDYRDSSKYFKPNDYEPNSDQVWAERMAEYIESSHHSIIIDSPELASSLKDAVTANDLPGMADIDSSLYLFCKEIRKGATVGISGECADEIFGGYPWYRREEDINAGTFPWSRAVKERRDILSGGLKGLPLEEYVASKYDETIKEVPVLKDDSLREKRMREMYYLNIKWFMITLLNRKDRMSMSNSLEVRVPFADYRIVEYMFNVPWAMKFCDDREKGLLRRALKGILPQEIIDRKKSPYPKTHNPSYLFAVQKWMREILNDKSSPILQLIDTEKVSQIVETGGDSFGKPWFGQLMRGPQLIAFLIQVDTWLRNYKTEIEY